MEKYVLMADIINSKAIEKQERPEFQKQFIETIESLNNSFEKDLTVDVVLSSGDSIQGVFENSSSAFLYFRLLAMLVKPHTIRGVISRGVVWDLTNNEDSNQMDGPAYHNAKNELDNINDSKRELLRIIGSEHYRLINLTLDLYFKSKENTTDISEVLSLINELLNPIEYSLTFKPKFNLDRVKHYFEGFNYRKLIQQSRPFILDTAKEVIQLEETTYITRGIQKEISEVLDVKPQNIQRQFKNYVHYERMVAGEITLLLKESQ